MVFPTIATIASVKAITLSDSCSLTAKATSLPLLNVRLCIEDLDFPAILATRHPFQSSLRPSWSPTAVHTQLVRAVVRRIIAGGAAFNLNHSNAAVIYRLD